ncbi:DUF5718 family protein [Sulfurovum sp. NBC37-1]|uniref:DUF5718 family protein n=1 Tax=Sulfurovum sp. (strain NBC37-1) TaxID=387093 RepID=UPI0001587BC8|nr:DUF5718 family protein [Sulfurovum sp. NBC37-1]BAF72828.1 conserved hypothetical protein [Sulfurovum sp. NBC37-1]
MDLTKVIGLGVAGNFAHHLEQAGELEDFKNVVTAEPDAPKGIFPFYLPRSDTFLGVYSIGTERLDLPNYDANAQVEPEIAVLFTIVYDAEHKVTDLIAEKFTTFNDCTIRKEGAKKISEKKSWGPNSKGIGDKWIDIDRFEKGGIMDRYHLCSFVRRDGVLHPYGVDAPLPGYSYFYEKLKNWLIEKMNTQEDFGPLENIAEHLKACGYPKQALISIGATAYAEFGEKNYLQQGDEVYVIAYDASKEKGDLTRGKSKAILHQKVQ